MAGSSNDDGWLPLTQKTFRITMVGAVLFIGASFFILMST